MQDGPNRKGAEVWENSGHANRISDIAWVTQPVWPGTYRKDYTNSPNRSLLLTASGDGTVRIWDPKRRSQIEQLNVDGEISMLAVDPQVTDDGDNRPVLVGQTDSNGISSKLVLWSPWSMQRTNLIERACGIVARGLLSQSESEQLSVDETDFQICD